jgi:long-chain fatty acid transport protein
MRFQRSDRMALFCFRPMPRFFGPLLAATLLPFAAFSSVARASGFLVQEQSASALGQGGAVVADPDEPAAVWFNPAALTIAKGWGVSATAAVGLPQVSFTPKNGAPRTDAQFLLQPVPNLFAHMPISVLGLQDVVLGLGLYAPFGLKLSWPRGWQGAEKAESISIAVVALNPTLSVPLGHRVSIAAGASLLYGTVEFAAGLPSDLAMPMSASMGRGVLSGHAYSWNANLALSLRPVPDLLSLALTYRTGAKLGFDGKADFSGSDPRLGSTFVDQTASTVLPLPDVWTVAASWRLHPALRLGFQVERVGWSTFERLEIQFSQPTTPTQRIERNSTDAWTARIGLQWERAARISALRTGLILDQGTANSDSLAPSAPDSARVGMTVGASVAFVRTTVDVGYLFLYFLPATATGGREGPEGTYRAVLHGLALTARFGAGASKK